MLGRVAFTCTDDESTFGHVAQVSVLDNFCFRSGGRVVSESDWAPVETALERPWPIVSKGDDGGEEEPTSSKRRSRVDADTMARNPWLFDLLKR